MTPLDMSPKKSAAESHCQSPPVPINGAIHDAGIHLRWHQEGLLPSNRAGSALLQWRGLHVLCHQPHCVVGLVHQVLQDMRHVSAG